MSDDALRAARTAAILGVVFTVVAYGHGGSRAALSVAAGAIVGIANLLVMRLIIRSLLTPGGSLVWGILAVTKMFFLLGVLFFLLTKELVDPMPMLVGYGVMPLGITLGAIWAAVRSSRS